MKRKVAGMRSWMVYCLNNTVGFSGVESLAALGAEGGFKGLRGAWGTRQGLQGSDHEQQ